MSGFDPVISSQIQGVHFGDKRLDTRFRSSLEAIDRQDSSSSFPDIFKDRYALKGFYRLMNNDKVSPEAMVEGYRRGLIQWLNSEAPKHSGRFYHFHDSTFGKYHSRKKLQLGDIETLSDNGFLLHSGLLTTGTFEPLGLVHQQYITRPWADFGKKHKRKTRAFTEKESYKWAEALDWAQDFSDQTSIELIHVMDREADIADLFEYAAALKQRFIIRAFQDRKLAQQEQLLWTHIRQQVPASEGKRTLQDRNTGPYEAVCQIRFSPLQLEAFDHPLWAVHLLEIDPVPNDTPTEWLLLTNWPITETQTAIEVIDAYLHRWPTCEDFHKCLKTGCGIEQRQFDSAEALFNAIALLSIQAVRLLRMRHLAREKPQQPIEQFLTPIEVQLARLLEDQFLTKTDKQLCQSFSALWWILLLGRMGGHQGIRLKGLPGWQTIWKGWHYFQSLLKGFSIAKNLNSTPDT